MTAPGISAFLFRLGFSIEAAPDGSLRIAPVAPSTGLKGGGADPLAVSVAGAGGLEVTAGGITIKVPPNAALNLTGDGLSVKVDDSTIVISSDTLSIKGNSVTPDQLERTPEGYLWVGQGLGNVKAVPVSGDASMDKDGVFTVAGGGGGLQPSDFVIDEVPGGDKDRVNTVYTTGTLPVLLLGVWLNGKKLMPTSEFTQVGQTITLLVVPPDPADDLVVSYLK